MKACRGLHRHYASWKETIAYLKTDCTALQRKARAKLVLWAPGGRDQRCARTYARKAPALATQSGRYAHARQFKRMRKSVEDMKATLAGFMRGTVRRSAQSDTGRHLAPDLSSEHPVLSQRSAATSSQGSGKIYALALS